MDNLDSRVLSLLQRAALLRFGPERTSDSSFENALRATAAAITQVTVHSRTTLVVMQEEHRDARSS